MRLTYFLTLVLWASASSTVMAGSADIDPELRQRAEAACRDDALRLCADAVPDEAAIVACMRPKRASLTAPCRSAFDEVARKLAR